jgi:hypothetical protein
MPGVVLLNVNSPFFLGFNMLANSSFFKYYEQGNR